MKATMDSQKLQKALRKVNLVKPYRQLPVLSNTLVEFTNGKATLTTTDMEKVVRVEVDSPNTEQFSILLPRKTAEKFLHGANGKVSMEIGKKPNTITVSRDGLGDFRFVTQSPKDFPPIPIADNLKWQTIDAKWFLRMLRIVATACASEQSRPVLTGIACNDGKMAAADGFRLVALKDARLAFGLGYSQAIIPLDTIILVQRLFRKVETLEVAFDIKQETSLGVTKNVPQRAYFKSGNTLLLSELIQGTYPNWEILIPATFNCKVSFSAPLLTQRLQMIDAKSLCSSIVRYNFHKKEDTGEHECSITAKIEENDGYSLTMPIKLETEAEGKIAFNYKYIVDAIKHFSVCNLELTSLSSPGKFTGDIEGLAIVVMPMCVQW